MTNKELKGEFSELLVINHYKSNLYDVEKNSDKYGWWDIKISKSGIDKYVQIKSCTRILKDNIFKLPNTYTGQNFKSIKNADIFVLVATDPQAENLMDNEFGGRIWILNNHKNLNSLSIPGNKKYFTLLCNIDIIDRIKLKQFKIG